METNAAGNDAGADMTSRFFAASPEFTRFMTSLRDGATVSGEAPSPPSVLTAILTKVQAGGLTDPSLVKLDAASVLAAVMAGASSNDPRYDLTRFTQKELAAALPSVLGNLARPAGDSFACAGCDFFAGL